MGRKKRTSEVSQVDASTTLVKWKSNTSFGDATGIFSTISNSVAISGGIIATLSGAGADVLMLMTGYVAASNFIFCKVAHGTSVSEVVGSNAKVGFLDSLRIPGYKRKFLESYFINHPYEFKGLVTREQEVDELKATHVVTSYLVNGIVGQRIEQEITEVQGYMWDKTMDSIDDLMTVPKMGIRIIEARVVNTQTHVSFNIPNSPSK